MRITLLLYHGVSLMSHLSLAWFPPPAPTLFSPNIMWSGNNARHQMCSIQNPRTLRLNIWKMCHRRRVEENWKKCQRERRTCIVGTTCKYSTRDPLCKAMIECVFNMMERCRPTDRSYKWQQEKYCRAQKKQHINPCDVEVCLTSSQCT